MELNEKLFAEMAGWQTLKEARSMLNQGAPISANWTEPVLKGVVRQGKATLRAGLVIKSRTDVENLCPCRESREWGKICAHSISVGLKLLAMQKAEDEVLNPETGSASSSAGAAAGNSLTPKNSGGGSIANRPGSTSQNQTDPNRVPAPILWSEKSGTRIEIYTLVPPNLPDATQRGKIMLFFEAELDGRRMPLDRVQKGTQVRVDSWDAHFFRRIFEWTQGQLPGMVQLNLEQFTQLLEGWIGNPRLSIGKKSDLEVRPENEDTQLSFRSKCLDSGEITLRFQGFVQTVNHKGNPAPPHLFQGVEGMWAFQDGPSPFLQKIRLNPLIQGVAEGPLKIPQTQVPWFLSQIYPELSSKHQVEANYELTDFQLDTAPPVFELDLAGGLAKLSASIRCSYGDGTYQYDLADVQPGSAGPMVWMPHPSNPKRFLTRDTLAETDAVKLLSEAGFEGPDRKKQFLLYGEDAVLSFFAGPYQMIQKSWKIQLEERLENHSLAKVEFAEPEFAARPVGSGENWFDLDVSVHGSSGEEIPFADIQAMIQSGKSYQKRSNGKILLMNTGAVQQFQNALQDCSPDQTRPGSYRVAMNQAGYLNQTLESQLGAEIQAPAHWKKAVHQQTGTAELPAPDLGNLEKTLRPYQKTGVAWMQFLRENRFGGVLADEMGLGKTLQTLAFLRSIRQSASGSTSGSKKSNSSKSPRPFLVVCPTSLVTNWAREAENFTPELSTLVLSGTGRKKFFKDIPSHDLIITSYALIRRDSEMYDPIEFDTVILDEAQHIKNRQTQNALAVKFLKRDHSLALSGTPMENSVLDLWSIFDFLMPRFLGRADDFRDRYENPILRDKDPTAQERLGRRIRPFILRRLKRDVAPELPERLEQVSWCELTSAQRGIYAQALDAARKEVLAGAGQHGSKASRLNALNALLRLRQICCDIRLLPQMDSVQKAAGLKNSGKMELFEELLEEILDGSHRALVFSQFTKYLGLIRSRLEKQGVEYCYLDGSTKNRAEVVDRFQNSKDIPVFLISLKAGGVGLNLTGADTVIHMDPWWNPAVEDQATQRAHRIGQSRVVTSYKLITRGTVEEKILELQNKKRAAIETLFKGEESLTEGLSWDEINYLLESD